MKNSTSSILKISHLALPSLASIISLKIQTLLISLSLTVSYYSLYTCFTFIPITLISCAKFIQSRQFLPLTDIGQDSLVTYFSVELPCTKALHINFKNELLVELIKVQIFWGFVNFVISHEWPYVHRLYDF